MNSQLKILATTSWLSLLLCAAVLLYLAMAAPTTVLVATVEGRDQSIRLTESSANLQYVQQRAKELVELGWTTSQRSLFLCRLAIGTLFILMLGTGVSLLQIRRLSKQLNATTNT